MKCLFAMSHLRDKEQLLYTASETRMYKYCITKNAMAHRKKYDRINQGQWHRMLISIEPCYSTFLITTIQILPIKDNDLTS